VGQSPAESIARATLRFCSSFIPWAVPSVVSLTAAFSTRFFASEQGGRLPQVIATLTRTIQAELRLNWPRCGPSGELRVALL
jgi:hypothetical protein